MLNKKSEKLSQCCVERCLLAGRGPAFFNLKLSLTAPISLSLSRHLEEQRSMI
jgi:hypothetical protein